MATYSIDTDSLAATQEMLGGELADRINDVAHDTDPETLDMLNEILGNRATDVQVMSAMYQDLEPRGTVAALSRLEENMRFAGAPEHALALAETLRQGLATASRDPYFPPDFGSELTRWCVAPLLSDDESEWARDNGLYPTAGASMLAFMMRDVNYDPTFLSGAAEQLAEYEKMTEDGIQPATDWYYHTGFSPLDPEGEVGENVDPMAEMMRAMSRQPEVGYDFLQTEGNAAYFFDRRDWSKDGYDGIAALADRVSTDPGVYEDHPEGAALIASQFVDWTANSEGFNAEDAKPASDSVGHLLSTYMPSMAAAMDGGGEDGDPGTHNPPLEVIGFGEMEHMPRFFREDLANMTGVAMSTEDGMVDMAEGVANYRQTQINTLADQLADNPDDIDLRTQLQGVMLDDSELRAFTTKIAGETEISDAHNTDQQRQFWTNLVAEGVKQVPIKPPIVGTIVEHGVDLGAGAINDAWANSADGVEDDWEVNATNGIGQMNFETYASMVESGVVPESEVPASFYDDRGELLGWNDVPVEDRSSYAARAAQEMGPWISDESLESTYRSRFEDFYNDPSGNGD